MGTVFMKPVENHFFLKKYEFERFSVCVCATQLKKSKKKKRKKHLWPLGTDFLRRKLYHFYFSCVRVVPDISFLYIALVSAISIPLSLPFSIDYIFCVIVNDCQCLKTISLSSSPIS